MSTTIYSLATIVILYVLIIVVPKFLDKRRKKRKSKIIPFDERDIYGNGKSING